MINNRLQDHFAIVKESSLFKEYYKNVHAPIPFMEKHTLREVLDAHFDLQSESKGVYLVRSGGSTDKPLIFPVDIQENLYQRKLLAIELTKYGMFSSKTIALNVFSYSDMYRTASILDDILERCDATTIPLGSKSSFDFMYATALSYKTNMLIGTPSTLTLFAKYLLENNLSLPIDNLMFGGEYLLNSQVTLFKKVFNTNCIYSLYGSSETGIWGWSTYTENLTCFEVLEGIIVEIESPDKDGYGVVVVTNLLRKRFPVFRYVMGDIGCLHYKNKKQILTIKSREPKSFSIEANSYFLNDFKEVLEIVDRYQIQISLCSSVQTVLKFLVIKPDCKNKIEMILELIKALKLIIDVSSRYVTLEVELVSESELYSDKTTSKTPLIIDFRI